MDEAGPPKHQEGPRLGMGSAACDQWRMSRQRSEQEKRREVEGWQRSGLRQRPPRDGQRALQDGGDSPTRALA